MSKESSELQDEIAQNRHLGKGFNTWLMQNGKLCLIQKAINTIRCIATKMNIIHVFLKNTKSNQVWRAVDFEHMDDQIHQTSVQCSQSLSCLAKIKTNSIILHALTFQVEIQHHHHDQYHRPHPLCFDYLISMLQISALLNFHNLRIKITKPLKNIISTSNII